jgi:TP53 regulating kinase-like protein
LLIKKGAEASLYLEEWQGRKVIIKRRLPKFYRLPELDLRIRTRRTIHEPQLIHSAKEAGVPTPTIYMVDVSKATIIMEYIEGTQVKQLLDDIDTKERLLLCRTIGTMIGRLHVHGIIHGDLTTSNMIRNSHGKVILVDFGLSERSKELEALGVDLHLMQRALHSSHFKYAEESFTAVLEGYTRVVGDDWAKKVVKKIQEIQRRGRYVSER